MTTAVVTVTYQTAHDAGNGGLDFECSKITVKEQTYDYALDAKKAAQVFGSNLGRWNNANDIADEMDPAFGELIAVIGVTISFNETTDEFAAEYGVAQPLQFSAEQELAIQELGKAFNLI